MNDAHMSSRLISGRIRSPASLRPLALTALLLALAPLAIGFVRYIEVVRETTFYPYALDYGEGVVWAQMVEIVADRGYGPIDATGTLVFHYPPAYHLLTNLVAAGFGADALAAGRLVSVLATIATAVAVGLCSTHMAKADGARRIGWCCGLIAGLAVFSMMPVLHWSRLMRVDMLALFFSFAGLYCALRALSQPRAIHLAALCFVAAVFTKQTSLAPPIAVFGTMFFLHPRTALAGSASALIMALASLAVMIVEFGTGFLDHLILYNINTIEWERLQWIVPMLTQHAMFIAVALFALASRIRRAFGDCRATDLHSLRQAVARSATAGQTLILAAYLLVASIMLLTIAKSGSSYNYFMEWLCIIALLAGLGMRDIAILASTEGGAKPAALALLVGPALALQSLVLPDTPRDAWRMNAARRAELDKVAAMIAAAPKPVISSDLALLMRAGKRPEWEPFTFPELAVKGLWDNRPLIQRIRNGSFAFFVTDDEGADPLVGAYDADIAGAVVSAYPVTRHVGGMMINLPRSAGSPEDAR
jgi:hypothetical protein